MKKMLLVLIALLGFGLGVKAQSCTISNDGTYVAVEVCSKCGYGEKLFCKAYCFGDSIPKSGIVYVTVYYINTEGEEDSEMITIQWNNVSGNRLQYGTGSHGGDYVGERQNVQRVVTWKVEAGACRW